MSSRLDYCNSLYYRIHRASLDSLQMVQNADARLRTWTHKFEHITPVLFSIQLLPVKLRVDFKYLVLVYKSLHNQSPTYLSELLHPPNSVQLLESEHLKMLSVPRSRLKFQGDRAFAIAGSILWNNLLSMIRAASSLSNFRSWRFFLDQIATT